MSKSREQLNARLGQVDMTGKRVLDVGCQNRLANRVARGEPLEYHTVDVDDQWQPDIVADLNEKLPTFETAGLYDIVFCIEVLEHCWNPLQAIENLAGWLKPGGKLYISTPFINPHHDLWDYLRYTDEWYIKVLPKFGLNITELYERKATTGLETLKEFYRIEGMKFSKIRMKRGPYTYPVGYFIGAEKQG